MNKNKVDIAILLLLSLALGLFLSANGRPYIFHPDEVFILKRPFKRLIEYSHFDFSSTFSLYDFFLVIWNGLLFVLGWLWGLWKDMAEFKDAVVREDFIVIYWSRTLSCIFVAIGNLVYYATLKARLGNSRWWFLLILVFNLILIPSVFWIKYEACMYAAFAAVFCCSFRYLLNNEYRFRNISYLFMMIALAIRIEALLFLVLFFLYDYYRHFVRHQTNHFFNLAWGKYVALGLAIWVSFTLYPLVWLNQWIGATELGLLESKTYEGTILTDVTNHLIYGAAITDTLIQYVVSILWLGAPFVIFFVLFLWKNRRTHAFFYLLYVALFLTIISLNGFFSVHYLLGFVPLIFLLAVNEMITSVHSTRLLMVCALYILSSAIPFLIVTALEEDPRFRARKYLLTNTMPTDTLAVETISMHGYHPLIEEFPVDLKQKAKLQEKISGTPGVGYLAKVKSLKDSSECRHIIDVFSENYLSEAPFSSNVFINTYDSADFESRNISFFVSASGTTRATFIANRYPMVAQFKPFDFLDPRCDLLYAFRPVMSIYKIRRPSD